MATYTGSEAITVTLVSSQVDTITLTGAGTELRISQTSTTPIYIITAQPGQTPATPTVGGAGTTAIMTDYPVVLPWTGSGIVIKVISAGTGTVNFTLTNSKFAPQGDLALKADLISPTFAGIPAAPTATPGTSTTQLATTEFVTTADQLLGTWIDYTPTWTGVFGNPDIGNGSITGRYSLVNKTVTAQIMITMGSTTTYGNNAYFFGLPVTAAATLAGYPALGAGWCNDVSASAATTVTAQVHNNGTTEFGLRFTSASGNGPVTHNTPYAWGTSDIITATIQYKAA